MKKVFVVWVILASLFVFAETSGDAVLIPREVFVGDMAELSFTADIPLPDGIEGSDYSLRESDLPVSADISITAVSVTWTGGTANIRIRFVPWHTGRLQFPPVRIQDSIVQPPFVTVASLVDTTGARALEPPRSPLLLPGTTWMIYGIVILLVFTAALTWFLIVKIRRFLLVTPSRRRASRRLKFIAKELRFLERRQKNLDRSVWFSRYSGMLKKYLSLYFYTKPDACISQTGTELASMTATRNGEAGRIVHTVFSAVDRVRFGGMESGVSREDLVLSARELSRQLEETTDNDIS